MALLLLQGMMQTPPEALKQNTAADDEELAYWTIVEGTCSHDNDDSAVTSSHWVTVEKMMGGKHYKHYVCN